ncbi:hypothetical protein ACLKA7_006637 [Drosophila subpalustris]
MRNIAVCTFNRLTLSEGHLLLLPLPLLLLLPLPLPRPANGIMLLPSRSHSHTTLHVPHFIQRMLQTPRRPTCAKGQRQLNSHWSLTFSACCLSPAKAGGTLEGGVWQHCHQLI